MAGRMVRTQWSKEPDDEPDYSDWKITLLIQKDGDDPNSTGRLLTLSSSSSKPKTKKNPPSPSSAVTFSIHRNILGPQSEYFNRIFKSNGSSGFSEARQQHSHIDFPSSISVIAFGLIVKAFEALLNYCYFENADFQGTSPVPLLYFCDYFQMKDDFESKVDDYSKTHFIKMASEYKLHLLYEEIIDFRTAGLNVERAQNLTAESFYNYDTNGLLMERGRMATIVDLPLWLNIVSLIQERGYDTGSWKSYTTKSQSVLWSINIATFLENNNNSIDANSFQKLTNEEVLPYVDVVAGLVLLQEEQKFIPSKVPISDDDKNDVKQEESSSLLSKLQNRCLESLVDAQLELNINKELRDRVMKVMIRLPNRVMGMYLNKTLNSYGEERAKLVQKEDELTQEKTRERYEHDEKRRKIEQVSSVLRNVEKELETEKEKYRLLVAKRVNNRAPKNVYIPFGTGY